MRPFEDHLFKLKSPIAGAALVQLTMRHIIVLVLLLRLFQFLCFFYFNIFSFFFKHGIDIFKPAVVLAIFLVLLLKESAILRHGIHVLLKVFQLK